MFVAVALCFPVLLLFAMLGMERVERPLSGQETEREVQRHLRGDVSPEQIERFVAEGYARTVEGYWRRRRRPAGPRRSR